jgi:hypothetical protein
VIRRKNGTRSRKTRKTLVTFRFRSSFKSENRKNKKLSLKISKKVVLARWQAPSLLRRVDRDKMKNLSASSNKI